MNWIIELPVFLTLTFILGYFIWDKYWRLKPIKFLPNLGLTCIDVNGKNVDPFSDDEDLLFARDVIVKCIVPTRKGYAISLNEYQKIIESRLTPTNKNN